jgi:hypothetical protein
VVRNNEPRREAYIPASRPRTDQQDPSGTSAEKMKIFRDLSLFVMLYLTRGYHLARPA